MTDAKEELRLSKEPFKTMVEIPVETQDLLRGWREPKDTAYILFQTKTWEIGKEQWIPGTFTLNVDGRPEQFDKVTYYVLKKGYRIIHYGNFPKPNHPNPRIAQKARIHTGPDSVNPWDQLEAHCRGYMNLEARQTAVESELRKKLEEATKKAEANAKPSKPSKPEESKVAV